MHEENSELFNSIIDLRAAGVHRRKLFDHAFTTDPHPSHRLHTSSNNANHLQANLALTHVHWHCSGMLSFADACRSLREPGSS